MRIPLAKVYRAFPELDAFSDAECERFVERAARDYPGSRVAAEVIGAAVIVGILIAIGVMENVAWGAISSNWSVFKKDDWLGMVIALNALFMVLGFCLGMLLIRDRWLIRTIRLKVRQASCPACGYSLLGLAVDLGVITCPECGSILPGGSWDDSRGHHRAAQGIMLRPCDCPSPRSIEPSPSLTRCQMRSASGMCGMCGSISVSSISLCRCSRRSCWPLRGRWGVGDACRRTFRSANGSPCLFRTKGG